MKTNSTQQEILLMINTSFSCRTWAKRDGQEEDNRSQREQLTEACWNGLAPEMLPECFERPSENLSTLWEIYDANAFIDLEYGEFNEIPERHYSINPYLFMEVKRYN